MVTITKLRIYKSLIAGFLVAIIGSSVHFLTTPQIILQTSDQAIPSEIETKFGLDTLFQLRGVKTPPNEAVIVAIDKVASSHYGFENEPLAWSRDYHAKIINTLKQAGATTIAFDIFFKQARNPKNDQKLTNAIRDAGNVILFAKLNRQLLNSSGKTPRSLSQENILSIETMKTPLTRFSDAALTIAPFTLPKFPAKVTRFWIFRSTAGDTPTIPIIALQHFVTTKHALTINPTYSNSNQPAQLTLKKQVQQLREYLKRNPKKLKVLEQKIRPQNNTDTKNLLLAYSGTTQPILNFYGPPRTIPTVTYDQVLENNLPQNITFKDKAIFIGFSEKLEPEQKDNFNTVFSQPTGLDLSGLEILTTAFLNLLHNETIKPVTNSIALSIVFIFGFLIAFITRFFREYIALLSCLALSALYLYIALYQFTLHSLWLPLFIPLLVETPLAIILGISWYALDTFRARKKMRHAFSYYVPETMVDLLTEQKQPFQHSQELQYGICMATDAEQYTQLSESLPPEKLAELMNQYYETLFSAVKKNQGVVSDVIGDAMLALWLPNIKKNRSVTTVNIELQIQACLAAIEIRATQTKKYTIAGQPILLPTRIGLHAGEMMIGNVGAVNHYEYRAVGDTINTTTRIEGLNKQFNTYLLASEAVLKNTDLFLYRNIGSFILAGKQQAINLFEIIQLKANATAQQQEHILQFHHALALFRQGLFLQAESAFDILCAAHSNDGVSRFYLQQSQQQRTMPLNNKWDGTITFTRK